MVIDKYRCCTNSYKIESFFGFLAQIYQISKRKILPIARKTRVECYIEHVGEHIGNQRKMKRNPSPPPPARPLLPKFKKKKSKAP
jgi:hypothetical protein